MRDLFRPIASRPTAFVITVPSIELRYFVILAGKPDPPCRTVQVGLNDNIRDLRRRIAIKELVEQEHATITILKVNSFAFGKRYR